jgi:4-diphosphocytidyl-2C-methyl-D-erythritol kinase
MWVAVVGVRAQENVSPVTTETEVKRVVQRDGKWFVETVYTRRVLEPLTTEMLFKVDEDAREDEQLEEQIKRADEEKRRKKAEQAERNRLLRQALRNGYVPEVKTLEEQKKVEEIRKRIGG